MTVLASAIGVSDAQIVVNTTLTVGNYPAPYTIGTENIAVTGGSGSTVLSVLRGQNGTAAASHLVGVAITSGWYSGGGAPEAHHVSHQDGGSDEIDLTGLAGAGFEGGTLTLATVVDPVPESLTGRVFGTLTDVVTTVAWDYDGDTTLVASISGAPAGSNVRLAADDDDSSVASGYVTISGDGATGDVVLTISNIGFNGGGGPTFHARVLDPFELFADASTTEQTFAVGTPASMTVEYRPAAFGVDSGIAVVRGGIAMYGRAGGPTIVITTYEVPDAGPEASYPIIQLLSANGFTDRFVLNRFGALSIATADGSSPIVANWPTDDPLIVNALWNDGGTLKVSAGPPP